jgi:hypothetical protein
LFSGVGIPVSEAFAGELQPRVLDGDGCGAFAPKGAGLIGVTSSDARLVRRLGVRLNEVLRQFVDAQVRHRAVRQWILVDGIANKFDGHGYCATQSYFVNWGRSCACQGDMYGAVHPNGLGVAAIADSMLAALKANSQTTTGNRGSIGATVTRPK